MQIKNLFTKQIDELRLLQVILMQLPETVSQEAKQHTHEYAVTCSGPKGRTNIPSLGRIAARTFSSAPKGHDNDW
jgi:hypothetical protein